MKKLFSTPVKAILTCLCAAALLAMLCVGGALAVSSAVEANSIGGDAAFACAIADAGIDTNAASVSESEFRFSKGRFVYDVGFNCGETEYRYEIDAKSGLVVNRSVNGRNGSPVDTDGMISLEDAKAIALEDAGVADVTFESAELDEDDGVHYYELDFFTMTNEYEYDIEAFTGEILSKEISTVNDDDVPADAESMIGIDEAKAIALADAGVTEATFEKAELDEDDDVYYYELKFYTAHYEYEYEINAFTGEILSREADVLPDDADEPAPSPDMIDVEEAKAIALADAGVTDATFEKAELDEDDDVLYYDIEFCTDTHEYEYEINAFTGEILDKKVDELASVTPAPDMIGVEAAKAIALADAGVTDATFEKAELDEDDDVLYYDIEFCTDTHEYEYEINAFTGEILDKEVDELEPDETQQPTNGQLIGVENAKQIAVAHAGLSIEQVTFSKAELDEEDDIRVYEIEFIHNGVEYEYTINACTGEIMDWEIDD